MKSSTKEPDSAFNVRKRSVTVSGLFTSARSCGFKTLSILIVIAVSQLSSTAHAENRIPGFIPTRLPQPSLCNWSAADDEIGSLTTASLESLPVLKLSPEDVFGTKRKLLEHREPVELVTCAGSCSDSCTMTKSAIPWSRWDDELTACGFATHDVVTLFRNLDDDFVGLWKLKNVAFVGTGLGVALGLRGSIDGDVREYTAEHPKRWGGFSDALSVVGNTGTQVAGMALLYGYAYHQRDDELMDFTRLLVRNYTMTGLSTLVIKGVANTSRPSENWVGGHFGFPSAHTATSFAIAATIEEYYGPEAGIPAYLTAGLIGWSRIDKRDHDLSDVVFGAVLGYAIAKSISGRELRGDSRIRMCPWVDPASRSVGTLWEVEF
jgi:membrane-associated phospholipid phosphatase